MDSPKGDRVGCPISTLFDLRANAVVLDDGNVVRVEGPNDIDSLEFHTRLLVRRLVELTGETERDAVHKAVEERHHRLTGPATPSERRQRVLTGLERSVWPSVPRQQLGKALTRAEEDDILGFGEEGV